MTIAQEIKSRLTTKASYSTLEHECENSALTIEEAEWTEETYYQFVDDSIAVFNYMAGTIVAL